MAETNTAPADAPPKEQKTAASRPPIKVRLTQPNGVFRSRAGYHVAGNAVVAVDHPIPPDVNDAIQRGRLALTDAEPQDNTAGRAHPQSALPKLAPHYRDRAHAVIPNFDVSTTRGGGTTADAGNHGPTGTNSAWGKEKHGDPPSEAAVALNRQLHDQQFALSPEQYQGIQDAQTARETDLQAQLDAARAALAQLDPDAVAALDAHGEATSGGKRGAADRRTRRAAAADDSSTAGTTGAGVKPAEDTKPAEGATS